MNINIIAGFLETEKGDYVNLKHIRKLFHVRKTGSEQTEDGFVNTIRYRVFADIDSETEYFLASFECVSQALEYMKLVVSEY